MSRNVFNQSEDNDSSSMDCVSIKASKSNPEEGVLRLLTTIAIKVTGGSNSKECDSVKAALASLHYLCKHEKRSYEAAVMGLSLAASCHIPDDEVSNLGEMPEELRKMREDMKEKILEAKKDAAERSLKNQSAQ